MGEGVRVAREEWGDAADFPGPAADGMAPLQAFFRPEVAARLASRGVRTLGDFRAASVRAAGLAASPEVRAAVAGAGIGSLFRRDLAFALEGAGFNTVADLARGYPRWSAAAASVVAICYGDPPMKGG
jgi:hypothetical protein